MDLTARFDFLRCEAYRRVYRVCLSQLLQLHIFLSIFLGERYVPLFAGSGEPMHCRYDCALEHSHRAQCCGCFNALSESSMQRGSNR